PTNTIIPPMLFCKKGFTRTQNGCEKINTTAHCPSGTFFVEGRGCRGPIDSGICRPGTHFVSGLGCTPIHCIDCVHCPSGTHFAGFSKECVINHPHHHGHDGDGSSSTASTTTSTIAVPPQQRSLSFTESNEIPTAAR